MYWGFNAVKHHNQGPHALVLRSSNDECLLSNKDPAASQSWPLSFFSSLRNLKGDHFLVKVEHFWRQKFIAWCLSGKTGVLWIGSSPSSICRDSPHLLQRFQLENDRFVLWNKNQLLLKICCSSLPSSSLLKSSLLFVSAPRNKSDCKTSEPKKLFQ